MAATPILGVLISLWSSVALSQLGSVRSEFSVGDDFLRVLMKPIFERTSSDSVVLFDHLTHPEPVVRGTVARDVMGSGALVDPVAVWILSHDDNTFLRRFAFEHAMSYCRDVDGASVCDSMLAYFVADSESRIAWLARDELLKRDWHAALEGASQDYALDLLGRLGDDMERGATDDQWAILRRLALSSDLKVRTLARRLIGQVEP